MSDSPTVSDLSDPLLIYPPLSLNSRPFSTPADEFHVNNTKNVPESPLLRKNEWQTDGLDTVFENLTCLSNLVSEYDSFSPVIEDGAFTEVLF